MSNKAKRKYIRVLLGLTILLAALFLMSIAAGFTEINLLQIGRILMGRGTREENLIVFQFRMVRTVLAILIGAGLALSGLVFQTVSKNALASPDLLGVSSGAGLAVLLMSYLSDGKQAFQIMTLPLAAILGAGITAILIYALSHRHGEAISPARMVLIGISLTAGINAVEMIITVRLSPTQYNLVHTWMIGNVYGNKWAHVIMLAPVVLLLSGLLFYHSRKLNLLRLSDGVAIGLGTPLKRVRFLYLMLAVGLAAVCVSIGGAIGFVGLICPHLARRMVGPNHERSIPVTMLCGACLVLLADLIARTVIAPREMLLGVVISVIGTPYFLYILLRGKH